MRVIFAGTPQIAVPCLDRLISDGLDVVAVLTREDAPLGRKRVLTPSPVAARAVELGVPVIKANQIDDDVVSALSATEADIAAIVAYGGLVPPEALEVPRHGWVNLHFSLLPAWRGAAPVQHSIIHGDDVTGAVTFRLEEGLDTGPVYGTLIEDIAPDDTAGVLLGRLSESGAVLLSQTLHGIDAGRLSPIPQSGPVTLAPKLGIEDGHIDWTEPALAIRRRINGTTPEPGPWTVLEGKRFKLGAVALEPSVTELEPAVLRVLPGRAPRILVGTGSHALELHEVQPAGKKMMKASDWARGLDIDEQGATGKQVSFS